MSPFWGIEISAEVIRAACDGQRSAHEAIYRAFQRPVYTLIRRLIDRPAVADEVQQEVFIEVFRSIGTFSGQGSFNGWIRTIAVNKSLMQLRSPWHRKLFWLDGQDDDAPDNVVLIDANARPDVQGSAQLDVQRALASLPPTARTVVWLHDVEGYTHAEIARLLGGTPSFSKSQLSRAHTRLRELLEVSLETLPCTHASTNC